MWINYHPDTGRITFDAYPHAECASWCAPDRCPRETVARFIAMLDDVRAIRPTKEGAERMLDRAYMEMLCAPSERKTKGAVDAVLKWCAVALACYWIWTLIEVIL